MRKVESLSLKYIGYKEPQDDGEVEFEILGLETVIAAAQQRIAVLKQSLKLTYIMKNAIAGDNSNAQIIEKTDSVPKN